MKTGLRRNTLSCATWTRSRRQHIISTWSSMSSVKLLRLSCWWVDSGFQFVLKTFSGRFSTLTSCSGCLTTSGPSSDLPLLLYYNRIWLTSLAILLVSSRFKPNGKITLFSIKMLKNFASQLHANFRIVWWHPIHRWPLLSPSKHHQWKSLCLPLLLVHRYVLFCFDKLDQNCRDDELKICPHPRHPSNGQLHKHATLRWVLLLV